jgi:hypothetical protein
MGICKPTGPTISMDRAKPAIRVSFRVSAGLDGTTTTDDISPERYYWVPGTNSSVHDGRGCAAITQYPIRTVQPFSGEGTGDMICR